MGTKSIGYFFVAFSAILLLAFAPVQAQETQIRGFADFSASAKSGGVSFAIGEQDLFITSRLNDRLSFLGETVFKYSPSSATRFNVSIERVIMKYNYKGNHNILVGKHHTPVNYWNDTYHHGRVFFPTIERPLMFAAGLLPLHTTGVDFQGQNLGKLKFGYDLMVGNGLASGDVLDNDGHKSVTLALHIKPLDGLRLGGSYYRDKLPKGMHLHEQMETLKYNVKQQLLSASASYFHGKTEVLAETTMALNKTDTTGTQQTRSAYLYTGYRAGEKWIPYMRIDNITYPDGEVYFSRNNMTTFILGLRYEINFLAVVKLELERSHSVLKGDANKISAQFAVGF